MARHCHVGFYRRHLPHWDAPGRTLFVTWRLHGAPLPPTPRSGLNGGPLFAWRDRADDTAEHGARWLVQPEIAAMVVAALEYGERELGLYKIHAFAVMPNHVHVLWTLAVPLARATGAIKGYTAQRANQALGRSGPFWQRESFDRVVRSAGESARIRRYIEWNPVHAGLANQPRDWPWSSARRVG